MDDDDEDKDATTTGSVSGNKTHFAELERILKEIEMYMK
jgi:hypothetical protein